MNCVLLPCCERQGHLWREVLRRAAEGLEPLLVSLLRQSEVRQLDLRRSRKRRRRKQNQHMPLHYYAKPHLRVVVRAHQQDVLGFEVPAAAVRSITNQPYFENNCKHTCE
jgi:hypothetical protein